MDWSDMSSIDTFKLVSYVDRYLDAELQLAIELQRNTELQLDENDEYDMHTRDKFDPKRKHNNPFGNHTARRYACRRLWQDNIHPEVTWKKAVEQVDENVFIEHKAAIDVNLDISKSHRYGSRYDFYVKGRKYKSSCEIRSNGIHWNDKKRDIQQTIREETDSYYDERDEYDESMYDMDQLEEMPCDYELHSVEQHMKEVHGVVDEEQHMKEVHGVVDEEQHMKEVHGVVDEEECIANKSKKDDHSDLSSSSDLIDLDSYIEILESDC